MMYDKNDEVEPTENFGDKLKQMYYEYSLMGIEDVSTMNLHKLSELREKAKGYKDFLDSIRSTLIQMIYDNEIPLITFHEKNHMHKWLFDCYSSNATQFHNIYAADFNGFFIKNGCNVIMKFPTADQFVIYLEPRRGTTHR